MMEKVIKFTSNYYFMGEYFKDLPQWAEAHKGIS